MLRHYISNQWVIIAQTARKNIKYYFFWICFRHHHVHGYFWNRSYCSNPISIFFPFPLFACYYYTTAHYHHRLFVVVGQTTYELTFVVELADSSPAVRSSRVQSSYSSPNTITFSSSRAYVKSLVKLKSFVEKERVKGVEGHNGFGLIGAFAICGSASVVEVV